MLKFLVSAAVLAGSVVVPVAPVLAATGGPAPSVVTAARVPVRPPLSVAVEPARAYGKSLTVAVRAADRPRTPVTIKVVSGGTTLARTLITDAAGVASWTVGARGSGTVTAAVAATRTARAAAATARFTTAGAATVKLTGYTRLSQGVAHYRSLAAVHASLQILPRRVGRITVSLQHRSGRTWITDQNATFATFATGGAWVGLAQGNRGMTYRYVVTAAGDAAAGTSPRVSTVSFVVDGS